MTDNLIRFAQGVDVLVHEVLDADTVQSGFPTKPALRLFLALIAALAFEFAHADSGAPKTFRVWVFADAHVGTDLSQGRLSLATALRQSESSAGFD